MLLHRPEEDHVVSLEYVVQHPLDLSLVVSTGRYSEVYDFLGGLTVCNPVQTTHIGNLTVKSRIIAESSAIEVVSESGVCVTELVSCKKRQVGVTVPPGFNIYSYREQFDGTFSLIVRKRFSSLLFRSRVTPWQELPTLEKELDETLCNKDSTLLEYPFPKHPEDDVAAGFTRIVLWPNISSGTLNWLVLHTYPTRSPSHGLPACVLTRSTLMLR